MKRVKISKLAKDLGVTVQTLWNWKQKGKINFIQDEVNGYNYVSIETYNEFLNINQIKSNRVVIYTRVSTPERRNNLETQSERLIAYAHAKGYNVVKIVKEIASGFNDNRKKLQDILDNLNFDILLVEHKDRLTRVGFNYLNSLFIKLGKNIEVVNVVDTDEKDIIQDFISIITSYTARIYGNRRKNRKTQEFIKELTELWLKRKIFLSFLESIA